MKIGVCAWSFSGAHAATGAALDPHHPEGLAALARQHQLRLIECAATPFRNAEPAALDLFLRTLADDGIEIVLDTGGNPAEDETQLRETLEGAARIGARVVRTTISGVLEGDRTAYGLADWTAYLHATVEPLKRLMGIAEAAEIAVGIENHQDICSWELCWLCEQVGSDLLGSTFDVGNAFAVGETPQAFLDRVLPYLVHVHIKDYVAHPTEAGYRLTRCAIGSGAVQWPELLQRIAGEAPGVAACIELGATTTRHIRLLEEAYWSTFPPRPPGETTAAIAMLQNAARSDGEDWRTPHERREGPAEQIAYEMAQFEESVAYLKALNLPPG